MFNLVERPVLYPAATVLGNTGGPVVDCGDIPAGGRVYIDRTEAGEIARHFGFATPERVGQLDRQLAAKDRVIADLEERLAAVQSAVAAA